jgi:hypothetical protein
MVQEGLNLPGTELRRVLLVVKQDVLANPVPVGLFGTLTEVPTTADGRDLIKQTGWLTP